MAASNVEVVERLIALIQVGDIEGAAGQLADDVVIVEADGVPHSGSFRGPQGFVDLITRFGELFSAFELSDTSVHDAGDFVVARMTASFTSKDSTRKAVMRVAELHTVRNGKVAHVDVYYKDPGQLTGFDEA